MNFRKIKIEEFDKLKRLFPGDDDLWKKYKKQRLEEFKKNQMDVFIIENENEFVGELTINYANHDLLTETIPNQRIYFEAFRVDREFQGKGLGQELINYCINTLANEGYTEFTIGVEEDNERAKHIYSKYGFTEAIDKGQGDEFDPSEYTLYLKRLDNMEYILNKLIGKLNLGIINEKPIRVSGGLLNRMYKVITSTGVYAIKHLNPEVMKRPNAINNHIFAEKIANVAKINNVQCISANIYNGKALQEIDGNYFFIFDA